MGASWNGTCWPNFNGNGRVTIFVGNFMFFQHCLTLLEDENATLASLSFRDNDQLLIEIRNKDLTWPEEMVSLSGQSGDKYRQGMTDKFVPF